MFFDVLNEVQIIYLIWLLSFSLGALHLVFKIKRKDSFLLFFNSSSYSEKYIVKIIYRDREYISTHE